jgi:hypothetical protein
MKLVDTSCTLTPPPERSSFSFVGRLGFLEWSSQRNRGGSTADDAIDKGKEKELKGAEEDDHDNEEDEDSLLALAKKLLPRLTEDEEEEITKRVYVDHCMPEEEYYCLKDTMKMIYSRPDIVSSTDAMQVMIENDMMEVTARPTAKLAMKFFGLDVWKLAMSKSACTELSTESTAGNASNRRNLSVKSSKCLISGTWNILQRLQSAFARNALVKTIKMSRKRGAMLQERFSEEVSSAVVDPNRLILQTFVLEQLPAYQRFALKSVLFNFPDLSLKR